MYDVILTLKDKSLALYLNDLQLMELSKKPSHPVYNTQRKEWELSGNSLCSLKGHERQMFSISTQ